MFIETIFSNKELTLFQTEFFLFSNRRIQALLDKTILYPIPRWLGLLALIGLYALRVWYLGGWYIVSYGLAIFVLNLFIGFISPLGDPDSSDGPLLPMKNANEEFKPFARKVPEMVFWVKTTRAVLVAFCTTLSDFFNIPVYWPILVLYFIILLMATMRRQIADMVKRRYLPCSWGKPKFEGGKGKPLFKGSTAN